MSFLRISSPHARGKNSTKSVMQQVALATMPGFLALFYFFGWGVFINIIWCVLLAVTAETAVLLLRKRPLSFYLSDYSAVVTGILLGLALPPFAPWWVSAIATLFAIIVAKQLYGGMGMNPFNPAMVGYALVLISFPVAMTTNWSNPVNPTGTADFLTHLQWIFGFGSNAIDVFTAATPLDIYKHEIAASTEAVVRQSPAFGSFISYGWEWVNIGFLLGGLYLVLRKIISWHTPVALLVSLSILSLALGWDADQVTPLSIHLLSGGTMLGAFFIATDPVTGPSSPRGKLIFGAGIGVLIYIIRTYGNYPDAVAFAVLLMNFAAPFIDYYTQPRTYGHSRSKRGFGGNK
ncbi:MAG: electron transport complex subunit RsxD [Hahellaceae bacterium]|nr:electron transport complex subunit RsxD [Hahellaceae bacterium]MCP5213196.1 electron transport complex subunit RsxD [Hahellaceae bacterium]